MEKEIKKTNKKKLLPIVLLCLFAVGVTAILVDHYGLITTTIDVESPILVEGDTEVELEAQAGGDVAGEDIDVNNEADFSIDVQISSTEVEGVEVSYIGTTELVTKIVDFGADVWEIDPQGDTATVEYVLAGDSFTAEVIDGAKVGYVLIYYKDNSDRFNSPAQPILLGDVVGNLPYIDDKNTDEYDYCLTGEYDTCHGAKLWYVPSDAIVGGNLDWGRASEFLYESELIQYNSDGKITIYPNSNFGFYPLFNLDLLLEGEVVVVTTVDLFEE